MSIEFKGIKDTTWRCDACVAVEPKWRYDIPPGTPLLAFVNRATGATHQSLCAGSFGLCDRCREIVDSKREVGKRLADRMIMYNPTLKNGTDEDFKLRRGVLVKMFSRLAPLLSNPRPAVRGEGFLDGQRADFEIRPDAPPQPSAN